MATNNANSRPISTYPIPASIQTKLNKAGFLTTGSVLNLRPSELSSSAEISVEDAADVLDLVGKPMGKFLDTKTALEILREEQLLHPIVTLSQNVDEILCGGVPLSKVTEISGIAGVGKTQLCLQLCVTVQIPEECGGIQGQAIFIDTEGSFNASRLEDMSQACVEHCRKTMNLPVDAWSLASIRENIFVYRCKEVTDLLSCVMILKEFLKSHRQVKLIVIDSLAFHFRHDLENTALRSRVLHKIAAELSRMAVDFGTAVVVTNQMTTKFDSKGQGRLTPALGTSWGHAPTLRFILDWDPSRSFRWATLIKSSSLPSGSAPYQVTKDGIRDVFFEKEIVTPPVVIVEDGIPGICFNTIV
ncbi:DNA repair protein RAD51 homolog 3-like isoform X2 [Daphnia pulex]|uniref:DNA repair protein RAD51 homolog 3-like isoform X2 n=1 Tax=Daphnia pulex TaxID=6669 RepID=UPI001EDE36B4|nr:DNA repair protein RAD51 homolog 3-like isoform X2 [Daphnia pulex]